MEDVYQILVKEDRWMTQKEIVEVSGLNKTGVSTSMRSLVSRNDVFVKFQKNTKNSKLKIYKHKEYKK